MGATVVIVKWGCKERGGSVECPSQRLKLSGEPSSRASREAAASKDESATSHPPLGTVCVASQPKT